MEIGVFNTLKANRFTDHGCYLINDKKEEVLLPNKYVPENLTEGDEIEAFVYLDFEERLVATNLIPKIKLYEFACLKVVDISDHGAYLDWGLEKDLFCPFREQDFELELGESYVFYMYVDGRTNRLAASTCVNKFIEKDNIELEVGEEVDLLIQSRTDLGYNAIISQKYFGLIYENEIFKSIRIGDSLKGYVKQVREDKKIDLRLERDGYDAVEPNTQKILDKLKENNGVLNLSDKSDPELIKSELQMSKKLFKKAIGGLYKKKLIKIKKDKIELL